MTSLYRHHLPQLDGSLYLTDAGLETDLIFNHGIAIREFAAHTLLPDPAGRSAMARYFEEFLALAERYDAGLILDTVTWKAHRHWSADLGEDPAFFAQANREAVRFAEDLREKARNRRPIVLNAPIGPRGDAYRPEVVIGANEAEAYYAEQLGWLARTALDMVTGMTFTQVGEAVGLIRAAQTAGLPVAMSFTVETDGRLPSGATLGEAIETVDAATRGAAAYFMINCAHPDHFAAVLDGAAWTRRIRGIRANASRRSHAKLDEAPELDAGDPAELGRQYAALRAQMPWLNVFGACCGADLRHVASIAEAVTREDA
jgi:homocysteine S-methyltransferase